MITIDRELRPIARSARSASLRELEKYARNEYGAASGVGFLFVATKNERSLGVADRLRNLFRRSFSVRKSSVDEFSNDANIAKPSLQRD